MTRHKVRVSGSAKHRARHKRAKTRAKMLRILKATPAHTIRFFKLCPNRYNHHLGSTCTTCGLKD